MPSNILSADTGFPQFTKETSDKDKIEKITSYLYMLLEQLRYSFCNLDKDNFNKQGLDEIAGLITEPVYVQLRNEEGRITALQVTAEGLGARMESTEGNVTALTATVNGLSSRVTSAEGSISTLQQTATSLSSRVQDAEGNVSSLTQTVNGMTLKVSNGETGSTIRLVRNGIEGAAETITFTGMVRFYDLKTSGRTTINGDNITTGTIEAIDIYGCDIEGSTFRSILASSGQWGGEIEFCYMNGNYVAGGIRLDAQGAGDAYENQHRMFIYTEQTLGVAFAMKLTSAAGVSIEAEEIVYIRGNGGITITAPSGGGDIELNGNVYINGRQIS